MTWITLHTIPHSPIVHAIVLEAFIHFSLMYTENHILLVIQIKDLKNKYVNPTTPFKLVTGTKTSVS